jgi:ATP-dependent RNA helicase HelY
MSFGRGDVPIGPEPTAVVGGQPDGLRAEFVQALPFALDPFQVDALDAIDRGSSVVVAAPTGSGKTIVAEYVVHRALRTAGKSFYTTPIKALSNQKYADFVSRYGAKNVGLLTGDTSINGEAPIVVMTTEVLRNMLYEASSTLNGLRYVVLDEVHYLQDPYRGPVWEEVIIHTPPEVDLVCLSATVSNASELADWVTSVRGRTEAVIHTVRPIELRQLYLAGSRDGRVSMLPTFVDGRPNQRAMRLDSEATMPGDRAARGASVTTPRRLDIVEALREQDMLPAIYFIFSRAACTDAMVHLLHSKVKLTLPDERRDIRAIVESKIGVLSSDDLRVLDYSRFLACLQNGYAAHHAGLIPPFKEAVEACFLEGLVRVVFATETLALGVNMPARTVVIEKLTKFTGDGHQMLTAGEYTQLTGRAGRRGIDPVGYAATLFSPYMSFDQVAGLASQKSYELRSAFRPTANMAVNMVRKFQRDNAHHLLSLSFAQFQIDAGLVTTRARQHRLSSELAETQSRVACERGDVEAYRRATAPRRAAPRDDERAIAAALDAMRPGDVLSGATAVERGARPGDGWSIIVSTTRRRGRDTTLRVVNPNGRVLALTPRDFSAVPVVASTVKLPTPFQPNSRSFQQSAASALSKAIFRHTKRADDIDERSGSSRSKRGAPRPPSRHPVEECPDLQQHLAAAVHADRLRSELERLADQSISREHSLSDQFDRILALLERLGYVDGWSLTDAGRLLAGIYHESDLLVAETIRAGLFDGLQPSAVAGLASVFVYEARGPGAAARRTGRDVARSRPRDDARRNRDGDLPDGFPRPLATRWWRLNDLADDLAQAEAGAGLPLTRTVDPGFVHLAQRWARGDALEDVLADEDLSGGDFVRTTKTLIDLLRQIGTVSPVAETARSARSAADALARGVITAGSGPQLAEPGAM